MAITPLLMRRRILAAKIETTPGSAIALAAGDAAFNIFDATMQAEIEQELREGQGAGGSLASVPAGRLGTCTFTTELHGSGNAGAPVPAWASTFLPAVGMVNKAGDVYSPLLEPPQAAATKPKTLTIGMYESGLYKQLHGAMGNLEIAFSAGKRILLNWTFRGVWDEPTDVALLAPTYPTVAPLTFRSANMSLGAWEPRVAEFTINLGNVMKDREDQDTAEAYLMSLVADRAVVGTMDPEAELVADEDTFQNWLDRGERALAVQAGNAAGSADGNFIEFDIGAFQITNVQEGDRDRLQIHTVDWQANRVLSAGDDEISITFN